MKRMKNYRNEGFSLEINIPNSFYLVAISFVLIFSTTLRIYGIEVNTTNNNANLDTDSNLTAESITKALGRGLDSYTLVSSNDPYNEIKWDQTDFDNIAEAGFDHVRLVLAPYSSSSFKELDDNFTIHPTTMTNVKKAIDMCIGAGLVAILDYHTALWTDSPTTENRNRFLSHWKQLAENFQSYDELKLVFELVNEPKENNYSGYNEILPELISVIRETNPYRGIIIGGPYWSNVEGLPMLTWPKDTMTILSIHSYRPEYFCFQGQSDTYDDVRNSNWYPVEPLKKELEDYWDGINDFTAKNGCPVIIGEWGVTEHTDPIYRQWYFNFTSRYFESQGWAWGLWDYDGDFGIYDNGFDYDLVDALISNPMLSMNYDSSVLYQSNFNDNMDGWYISTGDGSISTSNGELVVAVGSNGSGSDDLILKYPMSFEKNTVYRINYTIRSESTRSFMRQSSTNQPPHNIYNLGTSGYNRITSYVYAHSNENGGIYFRIGGSSADFYVSNLTVELITPDISDITYEAIGPEKSSHIEDSSDIEEPVDIEEPTDLEDPVLQNILVDTRDNQEYNIVKIGDQWWMAENLNYGNQITGNQNQMDNNSVEKYCYNDQGANCSQYGGLYQWDEMMQYNTGDSIQGICPSGWHVPSENEWQQLEAHLGLASSELDDIGSRGTDQGTQLLENGNSGFEAKLAGKRDASGVFKSLDEYTTFWNTSEGNRTLSNQWPTIYKASNDDKNNAFSVRCIKDNDFDVAEVPKKYEGPVFYIDPNSSETEGADGSIEKPFKSWADVEWVDSCEYVQKNNTNCFEEKIIVGANNVTLGSYGDGVPATIVSSAFDYAISIFEKNDITIQNLNIKASEAMSCIYMMGCTKENNIIENCVLSKADFGLRVIDGNKFTIRYNTFDNEVDGVYAMSEQIEVYYNIFVNQETGINIASLSTNALISNNVFYNNIRSISSTYSSMELYNNIFYLKNEGDIAININIDKLLSDNNIFYPQQDGFIVINNESFNELKTYQEKYGIDMYSLTCDPMFVDMYNGIFTLLPGSPAVNRGKNIDLGTDFFGLEVPKNDITDIGINETNQLKSDMTGASDIYSSITYSLYPNPSKGVVNISLNKAQSETSSIEVKDISGKVVHQQHMMSNTGQIDLSQYPKGVYFLTLKNGQDLAQEKIILQ